MDLKLIPTFIIVSLIIMETSSALVDRYKKPSIFFELGYGLPSAINFKSSRNCLTLSFAFKISPIDCIPVVIKNNYCTGLCSSYFIPAQGTKTPKAESCNVCKPARRSMYKKTINLKCFKREGNRIINISKAFDVSIVNKCKCGSCSRNY